MKSVGLAILVLAAAPAVAQHTAHTNPYAGMQHHAIKSLPPAEVESLLAGHGMALARAAELNGYPGPMHVIELSQQMKLTPAQLEASQQLMQQHRERARKLGAELVEAERRLDALFAQQQAETSNVSTATERVGNLQAKLRAEHLNTHLQQKALLTAEQVQRYSELRGYQAAHSPSHRSHSK
ncbi:MAG: Spy/CpxP family protein refolding chaperone [Burkholderiaceae bacterium]